jgi:hypothetical protein
MDACILFLGGVVVLRTCGWTHLINTGSGGGMPSNNITPHTHMDSHTEPATTSAPMKNGW